VPFPQTSDPNLPAGSTLTNRQAGFIEGSPGIPSQQYIFGHQNSSSFDCDGTVANACGIVIQDKLLAQGDPTMDASNSVMLPVTFAAPTAGCTPASINAESEFGIELVTQVQEALSCNSNPKTAVLPTVTANDGLGAVQALQSGGVQIAFTDDPEAADQQKVLSSGSFKLIPIALTANVVGFYGQLVDPMTSQTFPLDQIELTPNMVAGLMTNQYSSSDQSDDMDQCTGPSQSSNGQCSGLPCLLVESTTNCDLFDQLNFVSGFFQFSHSASYWRADPAGTTGQLFDWLCSAPTVPLNYGSGFPQGPTEKESSAQVLEQGLGGLGGSSSSNCPKGVEQLPGVPNNRIFFGVGSTPELQTVHAQSIVSSEPPPTDAFVNMNWAEALYYGYSVASLQNAAGQFVQPDATSLDAALGDASTNPDGSITPSYTNSGDQSSYPMPSIIYAAVNTKPTTAQNASEESGFLNQLLGVTGAGQPEVSSLPPGFVPLPTNLVSEAQNDIKQDIVATPATSTPPNNGGNGNAGSSGAPGSSNPSSSSFPSFPSGQAFAGLLYGAPTNTLPLFGGSTPLAGIAANSLAHAGRGAGPRGPLLGPALPGYALAASDGSTVIALALIFGLIGLLAGLVLLGTGALTRLRGMRKKDAAPDEGTGVADIVTGAAAPTT
jgi:hypothetical protein